jgi:hypothetical protein
VVERRDYALCEWEENPIAVPSIAPPGHIATANPRAAVLHTLSDMRAIRLSSVARAGESQRPVLVLGSDRGAASDLLPLVVPPADGVLELA